MQSVKCVLVGDEITEKSALLITITRSNETPKESVPTVYENCSFKVMCDEKPVMLALWDTPGLDGIDKARTSSYAQANVFMLVFSVVDRSSLISVLTKYLPEILFHCPKVPIVLVGAKIELRDDPATQAQLKLRGEQAISPQEGLKLAQDINASSYIEYSMKKFIGVREVFTTVTKAALSLSPKWPAAENIAICGMKEAFKTDDVDLAYHFIDKMGNVNIKDENGTTLLEQACSYEHGKVEVARLLVLCGAGENENVSASKLPPKVVSLIWHLQSQNAKRPKSFYFLQGLHIKYVPNNLIEAMRNFEEIDLSDNMLTSISIPPNFTVTKLRLNRNNFDIFPSIQSLVLKSLDLSMNSITEIPSGILTDLPNLEWLGVAHNKLESIPADLGALKNIFATGNPLSEILPAYRNDNDKILYFLRLAKGEQAKPWNQIKLMFLGHEGVGKTTLVNCLQDNKYKCATNISTNGVSISTLQLSHKLSKSSLISKLAPRDQKEQREGSVQCNVWDFGGQAVFHATHRFFITSNALYIILYNMSKPKTLERVKYWLEQVGAKHDLEGTKPILIVGTHADLISKQDRAKIVEAVQLKYPVAASPQHNRSQIWGHFVVSNTQGDKAGLAELQAKIMDIARNHPRIGIGKVIVPFSFSLLQQELHDMKSQKSYMKWAKYAALGASLGIGEDEIEAITSMLHDTGVLVWHNVHKLRDVVIIDPQWLADAMAGVISFMCQISVAKFGGMTNWSKMRESLGLKFTNPAMQETIMSLLEFFEIVYKMRMNSNITISTTLINEEQMFFVPSLLSQFGGEVHPSVQYWQQMAVKQEFTRRFYWSFFPSGFFPRLLVRLVHLRMTLLSAWIDAAIIIARGGADCAFLRVARSSNEKFCLEISIKSEIVATPREEPLIAELSYIIARLHRDMYMNVHSEVPLEHKVVFHNKSQELPFEDCIKAQIEGQEYLEAGAIRVKLDDIVPDLSCCPCIHFSNFVTEKKLGEGGFGVVFKAILKINDKQLNVALKELRLKEEVNAIYEFQHEITIMSKLRHENLVRLYGITKSPLRMVLEFLPESDLHSILLSNNSLSPKWRLKVAVDMAIGLKYLHSQHPPICHSDLRAPNIFISSLDEEAPLIAKIADFGLSQQVFPFSQQTLHNITETAPETWGTGSFYDEKSDIFSFAVILWRLFGASEVYSKTKSLEPSDEDDAFLREKGKYLPPPRQREAIRKGGRLRIHKMCPPAIATLISDCWQTLPDARPPISSVISTLLDFYGRKYGEREYVLQKTKAQAKTGATTPQTEDNLPEGELPKLSFYEKAWKPIKLQEETTATVLVQMGSEIWMGTSSGLLFVAEPKTCQIQKISLPPAAPSHKSGIQVISTGVHFLWAALGTEIHILSAKTRRAVATPLTNQHQIVHMILLRNSTAVWMADVAGYVSIWDAQTLQKCYRFSIHPSNCAQAMAELNDYVWMALGKDLIAVHSTTLSTTAQSAHNDRIYQILAVPLANQVWTSSRDGTLRVWKMERKEKVTIKKIQEFALAAPITSISLMTDGLRVCTGTFDGVITLWDVRNFNRVDVPTPEGVKKHSIQCILDTETDLLCGIECSIQPLQCHSKNAIRPARATFDYC